MLFHLQITWWNGRKTGKKDWKCKSIRITLWSRMWLLGNYLIGVALLQSYDNKWWITLVTLHVWMHNVILFRNSRRILRWRSSSPSWKWNHWWSSSSNCYLHRSFLHRYWCHVKGINSRKRTHSRRHFSGLFLSRLQLQIASRKLHSHLL